MQLHTEKLIKISSTICKSRMKVRQLLFLLLCLFFLDSRDESPYGLPGCESQVRSALQKLKGVDNVDIDMAMQKVTITGWADQKKVLKTVRKTGRRAEMWQFPYSADHNNFSTDQYYNQQCNGPLYNYAPQPSSWYNYYKHGYDGPSHGYSQNPANSTRTYSYQTTAAFSDENPHACSIM